jgi:hypothetical protein
MRRMPKDLVLSSASRVMIDTRASGLAAALHPETTFTAPAEPATLKDVPDEGELDLAVEASVAVTKLFPPDRVSGGDREKMVENLRGKEVLDAARWPLVTFRGRYEGTFTSGRLAGDLIVRGAPHPVAFPVHVTASGDTLRARGDWEGKLTDIGVKPFRALLGALRLADYVKIRLDLTFERAV